MKREKTMIQELFQELCKQLAIAYKNDDMSEVAYITDQINEMMGYEQK
jgi:hypothetical protein